jgi:hypothetical protein
MSNKKIGSNWREFEFMFHQVQHAINPCISLIQTISDWQTIREGLAENNRKRKPQVSNFKFS